MLLNFAVKVKIEIADCEFLVGRARHKGSMYLNCGRFGHNRPHLWSNSPADLRLTHKKSTRDYRPGHTLLPKHTTSRGTAIWSRVQSSQPVADLGLFGFTLDRIDHAHGNAFPTACASRRPHSRGCSQTGSPACRTGAPDVSDPNAQPPAAVGEPPLLDDRVMPGDEPDLGSRLLVSYSGTAPSPPCRLFADAEIGEDPIEDLFRRRTTGDLSE